jgi:hypothetical protein
VLMAKYYTKTHLHMFLAVHTALVQLSVILPNHYYPEFFEFLDLSVKH